MSIFLKTRTVFMPAFERPDADDIITSSMQFPCLDVMLDHEGDLILSQWHRYDDELPPDVHQVMVPREALPELIKWLQDNVEAQKPELAENLQRYFEGDPPA